MTERSDHTPTDYTLLPEMGEGVFTAPLQRPAHVGEDWLEPVQRAYSPAEHAVWDTLYARQLQVLPGRAARAFMAGLERLDLGRGGVPDFARLSGELGALTVWGVVPGADADPRSRVLLASGQPPLPGG